MAVKKPLRETLPPNSPERWQLDATSTRLIAYEILIKPHRVVLYGLSSEVERRKTAIDSFFAKAFQVRFEQGMAEGRRLCLEEQKAALLQGRPVSVSTAAAAPSRRTTLTKPAAATSGPPRGRTGAARKSPSRKASKTRSTRRRS